MKTTNHARPWHRDSLFGPGPRRRLDREQRGRFRFLLNAHARASRLPAKQHLVGTALLKRLGNDGQCDPSHATLAADAAVSVRTVRRATATMRALGLLHWQHRIVRAGWRAEQTSNAYVLTLTENPPPRCGGQSVRQTGPIENRSFLSANAPDREEDRQALAGVRAVMEARLLRNKRGGFAVSAPESGRSAR